MVAMSFSKCFRLSYVCLLLYAICYGEKIPCAHNPGGCAGGLCMGFWGMVFGGFWLRVPGRAPGGFLEGFLDCLGKLDLAGARHRNFTRGLSTMPSTLPSITFDVISNTIPDCISQFETKLHERIYHQEARFSTVVSHHETWIICH